MKITPQDFFKNGNVTIVNPVEQTQTPDLKSSFLQRVNEKMQGRAEGLKQDIQSYKQGKQNLADTALQTAGQFAGGFNDILGEVPGVSAAMGGIEKLGAGIGNVINKVADPLINLGVKGANAIPLGQSLRDITQTVSNDPTLQRNLSAVGNIGMAYAGAKGITGGGAGLADITKAGVDVAAPKILPAINAAGRVIKNTGEGAYGLTIAPESSTARALLNYDAKQPGLFGRIKNMLSGEETGKPITEAQTAARHGLTGTEYQLGVQAKQLQNDLWNNKVLPELRAIKGKVDIKNFLGTVRKEINTISDLTRRKQLLSAFDKVAEDYKHVGKINAEKLQNYKVDWSQFLPDATYEGKPIAAALKEVHSIMADKARAIIHKNISPAAKMAYLDYGNLNSIIESGLKSITGDPATKSFSRDIWQFIMNKGITPIATIGGKVLYKTGEGLEFVGQKGAKKIDDIVK